eukprot:scaffold7127_cov156-Isochrysis_galbana.AAC.2
MDSCCYYNMMFLAPVVNRAPQRGPGCPQAPQRGLRVDRIQGGAVQQQRLARPNSGVFSQILAIPRPHTLPLRSNRATK